MLLLCAATSATEKEVAGRSRPPSLQSLAGGKQPPVGQKGRGDLQRQKRWAMTFEKSHLFESEVLRSLAGVPGKWGLLLNTTVRTERHKRHGNIQKPLGGLPELSASLSINHDLISPSAWSSMGP